MYSSYFLFEEVEIVTTFVEICSLVRRVNVSFVEQMRRNLRAKLKGIERFVCIGWHEECNRYFGY